jgi:hypothetical protein
MVREPKHVGHATTTRGSARCWRPGGHLRRVIQSPVPEAGSSKKRKVGPSKGNGKEKEKDGLELELGVDGDTRDA